MLPGLAPVLAPPAPAVLVTLEAPPLNNLPTQSETPGIDPRAPAPARIEPNGEAEELAL